MNIYCPEPCITCAPNPAGTDGVFPNPNAEANPFANFSAEKPDQNLFIGNNYGNPGNPGGMDGPPLGQPWNATGCIGVCISTVSQADADICAANQKVLCNSGDWPNHPPGNDPELCAQFPTLDECQPPFRKLFFNEEQSCTVTCPDGTPFTFTVRANTYSQFTLAQANAVAASFACKGANANRACFSSLSPAACCEGESYAGLVFITSGFVSPTPFAFTITAGALPPGLSLVQTGNRSVEITGIPEAVGDYDFTITATHPSFQTISKGYSLPVKSIATASPLPDATSGVAYSETLVTGGTIEGAATWTLASGELPPGLELDGITGEISGTPTDVVETSYGFTIAMTDGATTCSKVFELTVAAACPSLQATIPTSSLIQTVTAAKDAAVFRAIMSDVNLPGPTFGFYLIDTSTNTILVHDVVTEVASSGSFAPPSGRFCVMLNNGNVQLITSAGVALAAINPVVAGTGGNTAYDTVNDLFYAVGYNGTNAFLFQIDPNTNTLNSEDDLGVADAAAGVWFCPSPAQVMIENTTLNEIGVWSIPGLVFQGNIAALSGVFGGGMVFASSTNKLYAGAYDTVVPTDGRVFELNPTTFAIDFTYDLGNVGFTAINMDYNSVTDRLHVMTNGNLIVINPTTRTVLCTVAVGAAAGFVSADLASGNIYINDTLGQTLAFH